jgi:hypothetical protein
MGEMCSTSGKVRNAYNIFVFLGFGAVFSPEVGDSMFLRNVGICLRVYIAPKLRRTSSSSPPRKPQISHSAYNILIRKAQGTEHFWKHRRRFDDNIKMFVRYIGCERVN